MVLCSEHHPHLLQTHLNLCLKSPRGRNRRCLASTSHYLPDMFLSWKSWKIRHFSAKASGATKPAGGVGVSWGLQWWFCFLFLPAISLLSRVWELSDGVVRRNFLHSPLMFYLWRVMLAQLKYKETVIKASLLSLSSVPDTEVRTKTSWWEIALQDTLILCKRFWNAHMWGSF